MTPTLLGTEARLTRGDLAELRQEALLLAIALLLAFAFLALVVMVAVPSLFFNSWEGPTITAYAMIALAVITYLARSLGVQVAALLLVGGLSLTSTWLLQVYPVSVVAPWLTLIIVLAAALLGRWAGIGAAMTLSVILLGSPIQLSDPTARAAWMSSLILNWVMAAFGWITSHPIYQALNWAWNSYLLAVARTEELRDRQGELNRTVKSLNEAYYRLEQASRDLERAREAAAYARELKARFAANISHELRTPLNLIIGFTEMMATVPHLYGGHPLPVRYRSDIEAVNRNAKHLASLIDDVLDLSQIDAGRMGLYREWSSLCELTNEATRAVEALFTHKKLRLVTRVPASLPPVYVDRARIRQVLINILANAAKFTDRGGATVIVTQEINELVVAVSDTGPGIAPADLPKLFQEFQQLDTPLGREYATNGLGLAISKDFIELHGGSMWAESRLGEGTVFRFSIPLQQNVASRSLHRPWETWARLIPDSSEEKFPTIAVLSEDPASARLLQRYLDGYRVIPAATNNDVVELMHQGLADALIVINPAALDSERGSLRLPALPSETPIIACSLPDRPSMSKQQGVADYLIKPVSRDRLAAALERLGRPIRRVLVVDDDPEMVRLLAHMIHSISPHYRVLRAYNGKEAVVILREKLPDAIVLDLAMPSLDGYGVLEVLQEMPDESRLPVIVVTARESQNTGAGCWITTITRNGGLGTAELVDCLKSALDTLLLMPHSVSEPQAAAVD